MIKFKYLILNYRPYHVTGQQRRINAYPPLFLDLFNLAHTVANWCTFVVCRSDDSAYGVHQLFAPDRHAGSGPSRTCRPADRRRERDTQARHPVTPTPTAPSSHTPALRKYF